jgi:hypothetical protein
MSICSYVFDELCYLDSVRCVRMNIFAKCEDEHFLQTITMNDDEHFAEITKNEVSNCVPCRR